MSVSGIPDPTAASAVSWLEAYQLREYRKLGVEPPLRTDRNKDDLAKPFGDLFRSLAVPPEDLQREIEAVVGHGQSVPGSRYDDPMMRGKLSQVGAELEKFLKEPLGARPLFGESPRASPNAMVAFHKASRRYVIILQRGHLHFFGTAIKLLAHACPLRVPFRQYKLEDLTYSPRGTIADNIYYRSFPWILGAVLTALTGDGASARAIVDNVCTPQCGTSFRTYALTNEEVMTMGVLMDSLTSFVLGHEYGHIVGSGGFIYSGGFTYSGLADDELKEFFEGIAACMVDEKIADEIGVRLSLRRNAAEGYSAEASYLGITLFFDLMILLKDCLDMIKNGRVVSKGHELDSWTHPPLEVRRKDVEAVRLSGVLSG